jgi:SAM-dependent methyltransferase
VSLFAIAVSGAQQATDIPFAEAKPVLEAVREDLWPAALRGKTLRDVEAVWPDWVRSRDAEIRRRVAAGDEDSIVHLMLFGTSFTSQPRASSAQLALLVGQPDAGLAALKPRLDDFLAAVAAPGNNARLRFAGEVIARGTTVDGGGPRRYMEMRAKAIASEARLGVLDPGAAAADKVTVFRERGLSSDTTLLVDGALDRTLEAIRDERVLADGAVRRVAIVGPGLDFIDKQNGYDFYPEQTIQPFAVIDSLRRAGLAHGSELRVTAFDLNPRVLAHLAQAAAGPYMLVLPRSLERPWLPPMVDYWERAGNWIGEPGPTPQPPPGAGRVQARSLVIRPDVVRAVTGRDLNIVLQRAEPAADAERFDLIVATNILLYYDVFEQSLAMANIARMLKPGGLFLTNNKIIELPSTPLTSVAYTDVTYVDLPGIGATGDRIIWYQKP